MSGCARLGRDGAVMSGERRAVNGRGGDRSAQAAPTGRDGTEGDGTDQAGDEAGGGMREGA